MSQYLPYDQTNLDKNFKSEDVKKNLDDSHIGYFFEVDLNYQDVIL